MQRKTITAVNHYDVFPFNHGGSLGIRGLYKALSEWVDVNIVTIVREHVYADDVWINNHVRVIPLYVPIEFEKACIEEFKEAEKILDNDDVDIDQVFMRYFCENEEIIERIRHITGDSILVLAEHVYTWRIVKKACPNKPIWYRANNVEYDYKKNLYKDKYFKESYLQFLYDFEKECCVNCEKVLTVSQLEADRFIELYNTPASIQDKFMNIKSGYDTDSVVPVYPSARKAYGDGYEYHGLYIASATKNAFEAAKYCVELAKAYDDIKIFVVGSVYSLLEKEEGIPSNVEVMGIVSDETKEELLCTCDFAMNLMESGAGINIKMFEYFAYGIPVIATEYGARGIDIENGRDCIITTPGKYKEDIRTFLESGKECKDLLAKNARRMLEDVYSWRSLSKKIIQEIETMYGYSLLEDAVSLSEIRLYEHFNNPSVFPHGVFFIRCAGVYGLATLNYLESRGNKPLAFVDSSSEKIAAGVNGIKVIPVDEYQKQYKDKDVIVANSKWEQLVADLLSKGVAANHIYISYHISGECIVRLSDLKGRIGYYDWESRRREIYAMAGFDI